MAKQGKLLNMKINPNDRVRGIEKRRNNYLRTFPSRMLKFFAGLILFIPLTMIAFACHCFEQNEYPWSSKI